MLSDSMRVIVLTGMPGSGKEEFVQVALSQGYEVVRMGDVVRAEAALRGVAGNDRGVGGFANSERQAHGYDIWARRCLPHLRSGRTVIDGSRGLDELEVFRSEFGEDVKLVAVHTSPGPRYQRLRARGRTDAPMSWDEFAERDRRELSWGLGNLIALADIMMVNESTLDEFRGRVANLLGELGK